MRSAPSRGQASVEHLGAIVLIALVLAGVAAVLVRAGVPQAVADAVVLGGEAEPQTPPARHITPETLAAVLAAVRGETGGYSLAGARALLAEDLGEEVGDAALRLLVLREARARYPGWFAASSATRRENPRALPLTVTGEPLGDDVAVHVVTPAEEAAAGAPGERGGWRAALESLLRDGIGIGAGRLHRVAGIAVGSLGFVESLTEDAPTGLGPGERAGDVLLCQRYVVRVQDGTGRERVSVDGVRVGVLRGGRLIDDVVVDGADCA